MQYIDEYESPVWAYFSVFKALLTRLLFMAHAGVAIWRVTVIYDNDVYWALSFTLIPLIIEVIYVMLKRNGVEWRLWYCPSFLFYLLSVVPSIWYLELHKLDVLAKEQSQNITNTDITNIDIPGLRLQKITFASNEWVNGVEQSLMVLLIFGRWLLPKGDLSQEQISQIFLKFLKYSKKKQFLNKQRTLFAYTISLLQFVLIFTSVGVAKRARNVHIGVAFVTHRDVTAALIELSLQDIPFIIVRMVSILGYNIITYTNIFFACKNGLVILLQVYRLLVIWQSFSIDEYRLDVPKPLRDYHGTWKTSRIITEQAETTPHGQAELLNMAIPHHNESGGVTILSQSVHRRTSAKPAVLETSK